LPPYNNKDDVNIPFSKNGHKLVGWTPPYAPPELLVQHIDYSKIIGHQIDVYCWAMTFYIMISKRAGGNENFAIPERKTPEQHEQFIESVKANEALKKFDSTGKFREVIIESLKYTPGTRPSYAEIFGKLSEFEYLPKGDNLHLFIAYYMMGYHYDSFLGNYEEALKYYLKAEKYINAENIEFKDRVNFYLSFVKVNERLGFHEKSKAYIEQIVSFISNWNGMNLDGTFAIIYESIDHFYESLCHSPQTMPYYKKLFKSICKAYDTASCQYACFLYKDGYADANIRSISSDAAKRIEDGKKRMLVAEQISKNFLFDKNHELEKSFNNCKIFDLEKLYVEKMEKYEIEGYDKPDERVGKIFDMLHISMVEKHEIIFRLFPLILDLWKILKNMYSDSKHYKKSIKITSRMAQALNFPFIKNIPERIIVDLGKYILMECLLLFLTALNILENATRIYVYIKNH